MINKLWDKEDNRIVYFTTFFFFLIFAYSEWVRCSLGLIGAYSAAPSVMSEQYSWLNLMMKMKNGNIFSSHPSINASLSEFKFYPYLSLWFDSIVIRLFGAVGFTVFSHVLLPTFCYLLTFSIYRKSISALWSAALGYLSLICFVPFPFRDFIIGLLEGKALNELTTTQPLELAHAPFPSLSLFLFLFCFWHTVQNKRFDLKRFSFLTIAWSLQTQIHPYNAIVGLSFWFIVVFLKLLQQIIKDRTQLKKNVIILLIQFLICGIISSPSIYAYLNINNSLGVHLNSLGVLNSTAGMAFDHYYGFAYFVLPLSLNLLIFILFRFDFYEFIYRFWPAFALLSIEALLLLSNLLFKFSVAPALVFSRLGIFFLHFYYLVPVIYFLAVKIPTLHYRNESVLIKKLRHLIDLVINKLSAVYLTLIMVLLIIFSINSVQNLKYIQQKINQPGLEVAQSELELLRLNVPTSSAVVSSFPLTNLLVPLTSDLSTLWVNRFSNNISISEGIERLALYAKICDWTNDEFLKFMSPGSMQTNLMSPLKNTLITLDKPGVISSGFGFWLTQHNELFKTEDEKQQYFTMVKDIFRKLDLNNLTNKFKVDKILTQNQSLPVGFNLKFNSFKTQIGWIHQRVEEHKIMEKMKSAVLVEQGKIEIQERSLPKVIPGSLLLKVHSCAVCGSDLRIFHHGNERVKPPRILGHEIAGEVIEVGKGVTQFKVGDHISVGADVPCGKCNHCKEGRGNCCDVNLAMGYQFDGGFSEYLLLDPIVVEFGPVQKFDSKLPYDLAALAEPLACCINGHELGMMKPGRSVVIFGAGPIGLLLAQLSNIYQASQVHIIDPAQDRLDLAIKLGFKSVINPQKDDPVKAVMELTNGAGAQMIFTACAVREAHEQAIAMVAKRGVVNLFGGLPKDSAPILMSSNHIHYREAYVTGSHGSTPVQHKKALQYISEGKIDVKSLISKKFSLNQVTDAFEHSRSRTGLKAVVNPNAPTI